MAFRISRLKATTEGVWVDCGSDLRLKVARLGSPAYEEEIRKLAKPFMRQMRLGTMNIEDMENLAKKAVAKHILQDWENLEDEIGKPIEFSKEKALELFDTYPDFYSIVKDVAGEAEIFRQDEMEESGKNLETACDSNLSGESTQKPSSSNKNQESK